MKITFLVPPCFDHKQPAERTAGCTRVVYLAPNIYELYVAAVLEKNGYDTINYTDFVYNKISSTEFDLFCKNDSSDIYFIWSVNLSLTTDLNAIDNIRKYNPGAWIIMLGPGAMHFREKFLTDRKIIVVRGEPELTVVDLLGKINKKEDINSVVGISYLGMAGTIINNPGRPANQNIDDLPFPARHLLGNAEYHNPKLKKSPYTTVITSRSCPFRCIYCVPSSLTFAKEMEFRADNPERKPPIGFRSIENIEEEIAMLASQGYKAIGFMDDNFIWNEKRTSDICLLMKKYDIVWGCQARVDAITEPIAKILSESNCMYVDLGIESFNDDILKYIKKGITAKDIYNAIELLKKYKVPVKLNVLIGSSPYETRDTVLHTLSEAKKLQVDQVMFNIVSPFPGTEFYKICKENGWLAEDDYKPTDVQRESIVNLPELSAKEMERLLYYNNLKYFISWSFISRQIRRFKSWKEFFYAIKALKIKLFG